jgi:predicted nucleotidyltransferase
MAVAAIMTNGIKEKLLKDHPDSIYAIILYGSFVDGSYDEFSDIDLVVVIDDLKNKDSVFEALNFIKNKRLSAYVLDNNTFVKNIASGDIKYKYEVLLKGDILYEKDDYIIRIINGLDSSFKVDFDEMISHNYSLLFLSEKSIRNSFNIMATSILYCCTILIHSYFADKKIEACGFENMIELMKQDERLSKYVDEILHLMRIRREFSHKKRPISFSEMERMHKLFLELKENFQIKKKSIRRKPAAFDL